MTDLISIILPVYNRKDLLPDCMNSLFSQTYKNLQIILIDDGSTDGSAALCRDYTEQDSRVMMLHGQHAGVCAARNLGLNAATGKYIFFVDSDDAIHPKLLQTLYEAMEQHDAALGGTRVMNIPHHKWQGLAGHIARQTEPGETSFHPHEETVHDIYHEQSPFGVIGGVMFRRDLVGNTRFDPQIYIGEDYLFIYQNLIKGASSVYLRQKWYYARIHSGNSSNHYDYSGFWTRFLRRKLVWESEEALGRPENAAKEKHSAFMAYLTCLEKNQMPKSEQKRMCAVMKEYRKIILPALNFPRKIRFCMTVYFPWTHCLYCKIFKKK